MLKDLKVLSFTHYLQGPAAAQILADLGADVIKIEKTGGGFERNWTGKERIKNGASIYYMMLHRNERSLAIDLKAPEGKEIIYELVKTYDIVLSNYRPGVMDRLGFSYEKLKAINPRVIVCTCSGWGDTGPYSVARDGQDLLIQGISGLAAQNGPSDHPPHPMGLPVVDVHGGTLAALGVIAAAHNRNVTGKGHKVEASLLNAALNLQMEPLTYFMNGDMPAQVDRIATGGSTRFIQAPYGIYKTKDGIVAINCRDRAKFEKAFGEGSLDGLEFSLFDREQVDKIVADAVKEKTTAEWITILTDAQIRHAEVNEYQEVMKDPQVLHNNMFVEYDHPVAGKVKFPAHPVKYDGELPGLRMQPPELGADTKDLLRGCGYSEEKIQSVVDKGVVVAL